jgi:hypothetical protein
MQPLIQKALRVEFQRIRPPEILAPVHENRGEGTARAGRDEERSFVFVGAEEG